MKDNKAVIVAFNRTAFTKAPAAPGKAPGRFSDVDPLDMLVPLINNLLERTGLDPKHVNHVYTGCVHQEYTQGLNIARLAVLHEESKLDPDTTSGTTVDRFCASSLETIKIADGLIGRDPDHVYICSGVQSMSQVEMAGQNPALNENVHGGNAAGFMNMGITAENLVELHDISREEQDRLSLQSHQRAATAQDNGHFDNEIVSVKGVHQDDGVRRDTSMEALSKLNPNFKDKSEGGTVSPGNSSQVTDGASAMLVTSEAFAKENGLPVQARILDFAESTCAPELMGHAPADAIEKLLAKVNLTIDDIDFFEINEAFAAQVLAVNKKLGAKDMAIPEEKLNVDGGAIAMGHPFGATGVRLAGHLSETLNREGGRYGIAGLCIGGGQALVTLIENPNWTPGEPDVPDVQCERKKCAGPACKAPTCGR